MSTLIEDIDTMHHKFGVHDAVAKMDPEKLRKFLEFRIAFLDEELNETKKAFAESDAEEIVDGLIDLIVVALGTLNAFGVDEEKAWDAVYKANMAKEPGIKPERPNPLGLPDMLKKPGWTPPSHASNHGLFTKMSKG